MPHEGILALQGGEDVKPCDRVYPPMSDADEASDPDDELVADHDVVLVDFYADWCGPCQMMEPAIEAVADAGEAVVAKVDVDRLQPVARQFNVQSVPTLLVYADGERVERLVGMQAQETLFGLVDQYLHNGGDRA